jgi:hypothetical protein
MFEKEIEEYESVRLEYQERAQRCLTPLRPEKFK